MRQSDKVVVQSETQENTERVVDLNVETLVGIVKERATGLANVEEQKNTESASGTSSCRRVCQHRH